MNMPACTLFNEPSKQRTKPPKYYHMICIGKTKCTSRKGLFRGENEITSLIKAQICLFHVLFCRRRLRNGQK